MTVIIVPWRPQQSRVAAFEATTRWYRENLADADLRPVDCVDDVFNLSQARNRGVASVGDPDEVLVIADADTIPQRDPLLAAIDGAATSGKVHLPYTEYHWLGASGTAQFAAGSALDDCDFELVRGACSGVYVTTRRTWESHGGQDERFRGWGFEDAAWHAAHATLLGEAPRRHDGRVFALHHVAQPRQGDQYDANAALMQRYSEASGSVDAMASLVAESSANARLLPGR